MRPLLPSPCRAGKTLANFWRRGGPYFRPPRSPPGLRDRRVHFAVFQATGVAVFQALRLSRDPGRGSGDTLAELASSSDRIPGPRTSRPGGPAAIGVLYARGCRMPGPHSLRPAWPYSRPPGVLVRPYSRSSDVPVRRLRRRPHRLCSGLPYTRPPPPAPFYVGQGERWPIFRFRDRISGPAWPPCPHGPGVLARRVRVAVFPAPTLGPGHWPQGHFAGVGVGRPSSRPTAPPPRPLARVMRPCSSSGRILGLDASDVRRLYRPSPRPVLVGRPFGPVAGRAGLAFFRLERCCPISIASSRPLPAGLDGHYGPRSWRP